MHSRLLLGTGGTVIPEPPDQQCGIFEAAFRHGVSNNKILRTLLCEGLLEDIGHCSDPPDQLNSEDR
ncbi:hypothetical protein T4B_5748 [Trichinella pseudospiralis]|uniref:Uncharacterized protein n=1 Tax=Trichinella pseudospiralis TaxID=6337 RepID=A0A0V1IMN2_TRIPS|nr:hypothetical protein T4B_5748 [Trichinella pseudospiralis]KRZ25047.1 hypothetical protein T4C_8767 [Trichinella pseudospiralis]